MEIDTSSGYTIEVGLADKLSIVRRILKRQKVDVMKAISVKPNTWRDWENGIKVPSKPFMRRLITLTNGYIQEMDEDKAILTEANKKLVRNSALRLGNPFAAMLGDDCSDDSTHEVFEAADLEKEFSTGNTKFAKKYPLILARAKVECVKLHDLWGVTPASISHWKKGIRQPTPEKVAMLIRTSWGILTEDDFVPESGRRLRGRPRAKPVEQAAPFAIMMPPIDPEARRRDVLELMRNGLIPTAPTPQNFDARDLLDMI